MKRGVGIVSLLAGFLIIGMGVIVDGNKISTYGGSTQERLLSLAILPGLILAFWAIGRALYTTARVGHHGWFITLLTWPLLVIGASMQMALGLTTHPEHWWQILVLIPLVTFLYAMWGPGPGWTPPVRGYISSAAIAASARRTWLAPTIFILLVAGTIGLGAIIPNNGIHFPSVSTTGTPLDESSGLQVKLTYQAVNCQAGVFPTVTLTNQSKGTINWSGSASDPNVIVDPSRATLEAGHSAQVGLEGITKADNFRLTFAYPGGIAIATVSCKG
jgi:hypothetical protein